MREKSHTTKLREKRRFWKCHLAAWEKSGLSQNEYCRRHNLKNNRLTYWKTKLSKEKAVQISFVPVPLKTVSPGSEAKSAYSGVSIELGRVQIRVDKGFCSSCLAEVVEVLERRQ